MSFIDITQEWAALLTLFSPGNVLTFDRIGSWVPGINGFTKGPQVVAGISIYRGYNVSVGGLAIVVLCEEKVFQQFQKGNVGLLDAEGNHWLPQEGVFASLVQERHFLSDEPGHVRAVEPVPNLLLGDLDSFRLVGRDVVRNDGCSGQITSVRMCIPAQTGQITPIMKCMIQDKSRAGCVELYNPAQHALQPPRPPTERIAHPKWGIRMARH